METDVLVVGGGNAALSCCTISSRSWGKGACNWKELLNFIAVVIAD